LVERNLAKVEVASSRLVSRSIFLALGGMAEWSCSGLQSRGRRFDSDSRLHQLVNIGMRASDALLLKRSASQAKTSARKRIN
jgi:hypothetical protein